METCLLLSARRYSFEGDRGGNVEGVQLTYIVSGSVENTENQRGVAPLTISAPMEVFSKLAAVPGVYDMDFKQRPGKNGRPSLQVVGVTFRQAFDVFQKGPQAA